VFSARLGQRLFVLAHATKFSADLWHVHKRTRRSTSAVEAGCNDSWPRAQQMANWMRVSTLGNVQLNDNCYRYVECTLNAYRGSRGIAPLILRLGTRWRWVISFTPRPLWSPVPNEQETAGDEKNLSSPPPTEPRIFQPIAIVSVPTALWHTLRIADMQLANTCRLTAKCVNMRLATGRVGTVATPKGNCES
jgi:hypothetical protein